ncbi:MAG: c-type cytochrome domain-containing protein, partial [Planctomycetaceae bacterium]
MTSPSGNTHLSFVLKYMSARMVFSLRLRLCVCLGALVLTRTASAADRLEYNRDIRPILAENCFACHGPDSASRKAGLRLDRREAAVESGAINIDQPAESELLKRIVSTDPEQVMPPPETKKSLTPQQVATVKRWLAEGAEYQPHWSFITPVRPALPPVKDAGWVRNDLDRFVLAN